MYAQLTLERLEDRNAPSSVGSLVAAEVQMAQALQHELQVIFEPALSAFHANPSALTGMAAAQALSSSIQTAEPVLLDLLEAGLGTDPTSLLLLARTASVFERINFTLDQL